MIRFTHSGRPIDTERFGRELMAKGLELGMQAIEEKARNAASSIIDPETRRYAEVFVDRVGDNRVVIRTKGSPAYARLLEKALGIGLGEIESETPPSTPEPFVYLAHATEDKAMVEPVARHLIANGIDVWFDQWDIQPGESLRQAMEEGLGRMTHLLVMLTPTSIKKPWVAREIDVGITRLVGGKSRMMPLRIGVQPGELSEFLQSMLCPAFDPASEDDFKTLVSRLHGVSKKPSLGPKPGYVRTVPPEEDGYSDAARAIAKHLVETSHNGMAFDPQRRPSELAEATGLSNEDLMLGSLELKEKGLIQESKSSSGTIWPTKILFVEFDAAFMDYDPSEDALVVATKLVNEERDLVTKELAEELDWTPRRMNSAIGFLEHLDAIGVRDTLASAPWRTTRLSPKPQTLRFVRNRS